MQEIIKNFKYLIGKSLNKIMSFENESLPFQREMHDKNLKSTAKYLNKRRLLKEKILGDNKITYVDIAHERAIKDNAGIETEKREKEMEKNLEITRKREYKKKKL